MTIAKAIARAWSDEAYKAKLLSDPHTALDEIDVTVPKNVTVKVVEDTDETRHLVIPKPPPQAGDVSLEDWEQQSEAQTRTTRHCGCSTPNCPSTPVGCNTYPPEC